MPRSMSRHLGRSSIKRPLPVPPNLLFIPLLQFHLPPTLLFIACQDPTRPSLLCSNQVIGNHLFDPLNQLIKSDPPTVYRHPTLFNNMLMYPIAHLACILAAAALCSGAAIEPRGDPRYDQPGSNLKEASIFHSSAPSHHRGVTKDRREYNDGRSTGMGISGGAAPRGGCAGC